MKKTGDLRPASTGLLRSKVEWMGRGWRSWEPAWGAPVFGEPEGRTRDAV